MTQNPNMSKQFRKILIVFQCIIINPKSMKATLKKILSLAVLMIAFGQSLSAQSTGTMVGSYTTGCNFNGAISVTVTGLTPPINYYYYLGGNSVTHTNVTTTTDGVTGIPGNLGFTFWYVTAVDNFSNYASTSFTVAPLINGSAILTPGNCPASNTAQVTGLSGGTSPYTLLWTNINTSLTYTANPAFVPDGQYSLTVTDAAGCVAVSDSMSVMGNSPVNATVNTSNANCTNGSATVIATGGITPYTYQWHNNASSSSITGLTQGQVWVMITDAQGCKGKFYGKVNQGVILTYNSTVNNATCLQNNGSALSFVTGGTAPYTFLWSNGATTSSLSNLTAGIYQAVITDANNCTGQGYVNVQASTPINVTYNATPSSCTSATGGATLVPTGGQSPYTIVWSTFPTPTSGTSISNKPAGTYSFKITDANG